MVKIINPLQINEWGFKKFFLIIILFQLVIINLVLNDHFSLVKIPILRQLLSFIYLMFIPGFLLLRIFKIHNLGNVKTILCTVGLSFSSLMFLGLLMNFLYPYLGISDTFSEFNILATVSIFVLSLIILSYFINKNYSNPVYFELKVILNYQFLILILIPFFAIFGTYLMNYYKINIVLIFLIVLIGLLVIFIANGSIRKEYYPLAIFVISISILFHISLISQFITGWDINREYYLANQVIKNSFWQHALYDDINSMLSIVILAPIFQKFTSLNLDWIFKIFYPFILALTPVTLFEIYKSQTNNKIAFLSAFIFTAFFIFYMGLISIARQAICQFFIALFLLFLFNDQILKYQKSIILIIFTSSIVVSHYGLSYIFIFFIIVTLIISYYNRIILKFKLPKFKKLTNNISTIQLSSTLVIFFIVMALAWYMIFSSSSPFETLIKIFDRVFGNIYSGFFDPSTAHGMAVLVEENTSILRTLNKYLHLITQFLILIGLFSLFKKKKYKINIEFFIFALISCLLLFLTLAMPYFGNWINSWRLYQFVLMFLAPFAVIGFLSLLKIIRQFKIPYNFNKKNAMILASIFFVVLFFFDTNIVYLISNDSSNSIALNSSYDTTNFNEYEVKSANWLYNYKGEKNIYADSNKSPLIVKYFGNVEIPENVTRIPINNYIYFGTQNTIKNGFLINVEYLLIKENAYINMNQVLNNRNTIYDNQYSKIYY